jgi:hypothetical protein
MNSIEQDIRKSIGKASLPPDVASRLRRKFEKLKNIYGVNFDATVLSLISNPSLYKQRAEIPGFTYFFRRNIDICIEDLGSHKLIYAKEQKKWIRAVMAPKRISLENPFFNRNESWAKVYSISHVRKVHHSTSKSKDKSKFLGGFSYIEPLELLAYSNGLGLLLKPHLMRIYAKFDKDIGRSKKGTAQQYICVECERIRRSEDSKYSNPSKVRGFKVRIHGYPMTINELQDDFVDTPLTPSMLLTLKS